MRIVLTEVRGENAQATHEFDRAIIRIGREAASNDLTFDRAQWPTVSRRHLEIQFRNGIWYVNDLGSANGTFVNGQRISVPTPLEPQARIQLGLDGPELRFEPAEETEAFTPQTLVDVEAAQLQAELLAQVKQSPLHSESSTKPSAVAHQPLEIQPSVYETKRSEPPPPALNPPVDSSLAKPSPNLVCEKGSPKQIGHKYSLVKERILIGRDPASDIAIAEETGAVSRRHAEIRRQEVASFTIVDLSFNGTLVNGQRVTGSVLLRDGDQIQLALGGPVFRFSNPTEVAQPSTPSRQTASMLPSDGFAGPAPADDKLGMGTIMARSTDKPLQATATDPQFLFERMFDGNNQLSVGRDANNDIQLDGLLISKFHARFMNSARGVAVQDAGSTNGVYVNGQRVSGSHLVQPQDLVQIGPFILRAVAGQGVAVFDTRAKLRIDAVGITQTLKQGRKLLDEISLTIQPNEFVGVLGPSGAGKSILLGALNGRRRATNGHVLINNLELYKHLESLKQWIGFVPQDDIIHRELTVYHTLYYVARLRLSGDVPTDEIDQIIAEVLDVTGLTERRDVKVSQLSGGQRKRVSIAVELITKPSLIFLDEPTSGLDPATEQRMMKLFRQIAESGRTVILTTHAMENVALFDRIALLFRGKLIFYGTPAEALGFVGADSFIDLYNKLEAPLDSQLAKLPPLPPKPSKNHLQQYERQREQLAEAVAVEWQTRFRSTDLYHQYIEKPLSQVRPAAATAAPSGRHHSIIDALRQWTILVRRYARVLASDKWNLLVLFIQAPIIGLLIYLVVGKNDPRDFVYFILSLVSIWFGTSLAARELVKERPVFERERMVNLRLLPYVASKLLVLALIVILQTLLLFTTVKALHLLGLVFVPGMFFGVPHFLIMALTAVVGIAVGLFVSALVKTSEVATSLVPLILIPQILFAGLFTVPTAASRVIGATMPATWSFDEMKRLSTLDTLKEEGADPNGPTKGKGLYRHIMDLNAENASKARNEIDDYSKSLAEALRQPRSLHSPPNTNLPSPPSLPVVEEIGDDLSHYVTFKHPWGSHVLNPAILFLMLLAFTVAMLISLRVKDVR